MGTVAAVAALVGGAYSASEQQKAQKESRSAQKKALEEQKKARLEEKAANAARAAQERRQQIREERVKRARLIQASVNTGVADSSGALGAQGSLNTQLASNLGFNAGLQANADRASTNLQNAANYGADAQSAANKAAVWGQMRGLSMSIFQSTASNLFSTTPGTQTDTAVKGPSEMTTELTPGNY